MSRAVVAVDLGGTWTRVASVEVLTGTPHPDVVRFTTDPNYDQQLGAVVAAVRSRCATPAAVGVSVGGRVDRSGSRIGVALNLPDYVGRELRADLSTALSCPVWLAHDATCGLLGEYRYGALADHARSAYVTLSTGVGCAIRLGTDTHFVATTTEAGHQLIAGNDLPCPCGQRGCLETLTGGRTLQQRLGRPLAEVTDPEFWRQYAQAVAHGLANLALVSGIEVVALGGGIIARRPEIWPVLRETLAAILTYQPIDARPARLGEHAPLVGAAVLTATPAASIVH
jgi:glucokinase